ncbi:hypothetical protein T261_4247 [Streptomyces lydicus]|nr:hypothetical protein T261_4247 [Streptomyces lydicus]
MAPRAWLVLAHPVRSVRTPGRTAPHPGHGRDITPRKRLSKR